MHVVCYGIVASDELNILSVGILIYLIFSRNYEYHQHSKHQLQMGPKEPGNSYSGSGKAAGALGHPGDICFICYAVIGNDFIVKKSKKSPLCFESKTEHICKVINLALGNTF